MCEDLYSLDLPLCDNLMRSIHLNAVSTQTENALYSILDLAHLVTHCCML